MNRDRLRIAVVGLGIGRMHLEALVGCEDAEICALCDLDPRRLRRDGARFGVRARFADHLEMLRVVQPDAVVIATPNDLHEPMVLSALDAGCHVLVEKPLAHDLGSARRIAAACRGRRRRVMIDLSFRFGAAARSVKAYLDSGAAGRLYHADTSWSRTRGIPDFGAWFLQRRRSGGGPVIDLAVHRLDLALWFMGEPRVEAVSAVTHSRLGRRLMGRKGRRFDVEDMGTALLRLRGGRSIALQTSWAENSERTERMRTRVLGEEGGALHANIGDGYEFEARLYRDRSGKLLPVSAERWARPAELPARAFVRFVGDGEQDAPSVRDGLRLSEVLAALYRSARERREVRIDELEDDD